MLSQKTWSNSPKNRPENKCQECGCHCDSCVDVNGVHLHQEIADLTHRLNEREHQLVTMESQIMMHANQHPNGEMQSLRDSLYSWQDKYERLLESYRKLQKVNQGLEDKLLRIADKFENEKISLTHNVADLTGQLTEAQMSIAGLQQEAEQYKNDCNLAIRMLQCKPSQFVSQKLESFPKCEQERIQQYLNYRHPNSDSDNSNAKPGGKLIRVPIPTFPPTAVLYSIDNKNANETQNVTENSTNNYVSAAIMAKILEEREKERHHCNNKSSFDNSTQTGERRSEFFIQMDQSNNAEMYSRPGQAFISNNHKLNNFQGNSSPTVMRGGGPYSKSSPNETIII